MNMKGGIKALIIVCCMAHSQVSMAQCHKATVEDGYYHKHIIRTKSPLNYPPLREADVMWSKRVWRIIDLREKMNHPLYFPVEETNSRKSLFDVIRCGLLGDSSLTAYGTGPLGTHDDFRRPLSVEEVGRLLISTDTVSTPDLETNEPIDQVVTTVIESSSILQYRIKEEWYFDRARGEMKVRIIGIAPRVMVYGDEGEERGMRDLFWLYYPECRYVFSSYAAFDRNNDSERLSYEALFEKRIFSSHISKESNVYDRQISAYATGIDHLLEAERIKQEIFELEHDLWTY